VSRQTRQSPTSPPRPLPTCGICDEVDDLLSSMERRPSGDAWRKRSGLGRIGKRAYQLQDEHPCCGSCGLYFGGTHIGGGLEDCRARGMLCEYCYTRRNDAD